MDPPDREADGTDSATLDQRVAAAMERSDYRGALDEIQAALQPEQALPPWEKHCELLYLAGLCHFELEDFDSAKTFFERGLKILQVNPGGNVSIFLHELSLVARRQGDLDRATELCREAIRAGIDRNAVRVRSGFVEYYEYDITPLLPSLLQLSVLKQETGDAGGALLVLELLRAHCSRTCQLENLGKVLNELGLAYIRLGFDVRGVRRLVESMKVKRFGGDPRAVLMTLANLRVVLLQQPHLLDNASVRHLLATL